MAALQQIAQVEMKQVVFGEPIQFPKQPKTALAENALNLAGAISEVSLWGAALGLRQNTARAVPFHGRIGNAMTHAMQTRFFTDQRGQCVSPMLSLN